MLCDYSDIRSLIKQEPVWFDNHGVPRYDTFKPEDMPNIYAREACLMRIVCQGCRERFLVGLTPSFPINDISDDRLQRQIEQGTIKYGDPPRHRYPGNRTQGCAGEMMTSNSLKIVEYWRKVNGDWIRDSALEIALPDSGAADD
jgi:hypothetical protein